MASLALVLASQHMVDSRAAGCSENFLNGIQAGAPLANSHTLVSGSLLCKDKRAAGGYSDHALNLGPRKLEELVVPHGTSESTN